MAVLQPARSILDCVNIALLSCLVGPFMSDLSPCGWSLASYGNSISLLSGLRGNIVGVATRLMWKEMWWTGKIYSL